MPGGVGFRTLREHKLGSDNEKWGRIVVEAGREVDPASERRKNVAYGCWDRK